ncbi:hypothetical protein SLA2020_075730 [Shorea laevis]
MSRITRWKIEKTKVKVVFRLQFHATHIPQTGWDKIYISFIPADSGKATAKTTKANVRNGTCKWGDPIYETTRLLQDIKTKQYDEKLYKFVVAMGSSRSSILGEATINLADYADASKPSAVALPLHGCDSGAILHVTIQLLTSKTGFREFEQQRELRERGLQAGTDPNGPDQSSIGNLTVEIASQVDKVNARVRFKEKLKEHHLVEEDLGLTEEYADSAVGFDGSSNTSGSLYAEKHDTSSTHEIDSLGNTVSGDLAGLSQSPQQEKGDPSECRYMTQGTSDWVHSWSSDYSADNDLASTYEENGRLRGCLEMAESSVRELKVEVCSLQNHAEELTAETQKFAQQLAAEIASGEQLAKEVSVLKLECSKLKDELEQLNGHKPFLSFARKEAIKKDQNNFKDLEVIWSKGLLVMEDKMRKLHNKVSLGPEERDLRFLHSDIEALLDIFQDLKQGTRKAASDLSVLLSARSNVKETGEISLLESDRYVLGTGTDPELFQPDIGMLPAVGIPGPVSHEPDSVDAATAMKEKIFELLRELDESKAERESLSKKMDQMECYYEALVQELEENQRQMLGELESLRNEHSTCLYGFQSTKAEMEAMHQEMNEQILRFAEDKQGLESLNKELERRAITAETALKRARLNYSIAVEQLQKDLEVLSSQVLSMFETHENLIKQAFVDSPPTNFQVYPEMMQNHQKLESEESHTAKLFQCQSQHVGKQNSGDILPEDLKRSFQLQEGIYLKIEEEICEMQYVNICLDVFSNTLKETLLEASSAVRFMKRTIEELTKQQELLVHSKELLSQRLQAAMDDIHSLNEDKAICIAKCNDMAVQKQILEANLEDVTHENHHMTLKINELEPLITEYKNYKSKYDSCAMEKTELANSLKEETLEKGHLQNDVSSLQERLKEVKTEFDELITVKKDQQNTLDSMQNRLWNLLSSYDKTFDGLSLWSESAGQHLESKDLAGVLVQLEGMQNKALEKILQLLKEKKDLMDERDKAQVFLSMVESDKLVMKQTFENDIKSMANKLDVYNVLIQKLQLEIDAVSEKLRVSSIVEENHAQQQKELLSDLECLEVELQKLTSKNREINQEILVLESVSQELESNKLAITELEEKNKNLTQYLQDKSEESSKLSFELNCLKESLQCLQGELLAERSSRDKLESMVLRLTSEMNEKHCQLMNFDQQKSEVMQLKQMVSDLESEQSRVCLLLLQSEQCLKNANEESSSITVLEAQLPEMLEPSVAADVCLVFIRTQYEACTEDLVQQFSLSESRLAELQSKHVQVESTLNVCLARESHYTEENGKLLTSLNSLKSELEAAIVENKTLLNTNSKITAEVEKYRNKVEEMEHNHCEDKRQHVLEIERLKHLLVSSQEEIDDLLVLTEELEVNLLVLKSKLDEQHTKVSLLEGYGDEVNLLQNQCSVLSQRLSEQIRKTEEFKNLSVHLKELKEKAEEEIAQAREKRESEGPPTVMQETLRIVFIKEQYETRLQEVKQQLAISKKHSEEMLWKLQDAIDEIETRKKSEASHLKKNQELGLKILELEAELQAVTFDKREKVKAYDWMKAELECSMISLECCKEEKQKLEASLQECMEEKSKISDDYNMVKQLLEASTSPTTCSKRDPHLRHFSQDLSIKREGTESTSSVAGEGDCSIAPTNLQPEDLLTNNLDGGRSLALVNQENLPNSDAKHLAVYNDQAQSLRSSMDHLNNELERMKNENLLLSQEDHQFDSKFPDLQRELMQLHKVNEELGTIYPLFNEYSGTGNALERILALEIELAGALQNKRKSSINFQSSFLKQHNDEEAIFKSFSDINELIKDMLELKKRYASVETELKEMHGRYSQLSLQFAEVEGERQKLMMTLKSVRAARKSQHLIRSSSTTVGDLS